MTTLLEGSGLTKSFGGVAAVRDVSLGLAAGEILALIGPNGAGKSTLFNLINGQLRADAGSLRLDGREVLGESPRRLWGRGVARTFQVTEVFRSMSVRENVQTVLLSRARGLGRVWGWAGGARHRDEAGRLLEAVGIGDRAEAACGHLAYGDAKRLELAMALASRPRLLLMDEPTAGMGLAERADLMSLAATVARREGVGILFTEHDVEVVFRHADRVMVLDRGRVVADGDPAAVRQDPRVREVYLGGARPGPGGSRPEPRS